MAPPRCAAFLVRRAAHASAALAALAGVAGAAEPVSLSLGQATLQALESGPEARIARLETERAAHAAGELRGSYLPQVGLRSEAGYSNRFGEKLVADDGSGTVREYSLATIAPDRAWLQVTASQILFDLKQWRRIEREEIAAEVARVAETRERDDVAYGVTERYARLLRLDRERAAAAASLAEAEWLAHQAELLFEAGRALEVDRSAARLHREEAGLAVHAREQDIAAAEAELWIFMGEAEPHGMPIRLDAETLPRMEPVRPADALEQVVHAPEVRILDLRRRMAEASVAAAKAGRLPTLRLVSGYSHYGPKRFDAYEDELFVGVDVEVPIFDGFRSGHAIAGAQRSAEIARLRHRSELDKKRARVRELAQQLETSRQKQELAERRRDAIAEEQRLADVNLRADRGSLRAALLARERLALARQEAIDARFETRTLWASLQRELGRLSDAILGPQLAKAP